MGDDNYKTVTVSSSVPIIRMNKVDFLIFYEKDRNKGRSGGRKVNITNRSFICFQKDFLYRPSISDATVYSVLIKICTMSPLFLRLGLTVLDKKQH
jgi:hypothetical protein